MRRRGVLALAVLMVQAGPAAGTAFSDVASGPSAQQYVERLYGDGGPSAGAPSSGHPAPAAPLPARVQQAVRAQGGSDAASLEQVATSPALGAPPARRHRAKPLDVRKARAGTPSFVRSLTSSAFDGGGSLGLLAAGLIVVTAAALVVRRRTLS